MLDIFCHFSPIFHSSNVKKWVWLFVWLFMEKRNDTFGYSFGYSLFGILVLVPPPYLVLKNGIFRIFR